MAVRLVRPGAVTAPDLYKALALLGRIVQRRALTADYRALAIASGHVSAAGLFGRMRTEVGLGIDREVCVDGEDFLQVLRSLPPAELKLTSTDAVLNWTCGPAKGHLAVMAATVPPPHFAGGVPDSVVTAEFGDGLELGGLASGASSALQARGLIGVQIKLTNDSAYAYATDGKTVSGCRLGEAFGPPGMVTLSPDAVACLAALIKRDGDALLAYDASSLCAITTSTQLVLNQLPPLSQDLSAIFSGYNKADIVLPIFREVVTAFFKRAEALSDQDAVVSLSVEAGRVSLAFRGDAGGSEEFYIVQGAEATVPPVDIEARRLAKALTHSTEIVFDYAGQRILILRGAQDFRFAVMGRLG